MAMVILFFVMTFFEFDWYHQTRGVDISALLGLFIYLSLGVLIHYYVGLRKQPHVPHQAVSVKVLHGIKRQTAYYLLPFILVYSIICIGEAAGCLAVM